MSGVNCTRRNSTPIARAYAFASSVLATPGTPSSSTCPPTAVPASRTSTTWSCPTTTLRTSRTTRSRSSFIAFSRRRGRGCRRRGPPRGPVPARPHHRSPARAARRPRRAGNPSARAACAISSRSAPAASPRRAATRAAAQRCAGASARRRDRGCARGCRTAHARTRRARAELARAAIGGAEAAGPRPDERDRRGAEHDERHLPTIGDRGDAPRRPVAVHAFGEHDRPARVAREREPERGVVAGREEGVLERRRVRDEQDLAPAHAIHASPGRSRDFRRWRSRSPSTTTNRFPRPRCRAPRASAGSTSVHAVTPSGCQRGGPVAQVAQVERRRTADDEATAVGRELEQGKRVVGREDIGLEHERGRVGRGRMVRDRSAHACHVVAVVGQQRGEGGGAVGRSGVGGAGCTARIAAADGAVEPERHEVRHDHAADDDGERDPDPAARRRGRAARPRCRCRCRRRRARSSRARSSSTRGQSRRDDSTAGGSAAWPP